MTRQTDGSPGLAVALLVIGNPLLPVNHRVMLSLENRLSFVTRSLTQTMPQFFYANERLAKSGNASLTAGCTSLPPDTLSPPLRPLSVSKAAMP